MTSARYGTFGLLGVGLFVVAIVALHVLQPELSVVDEYTSVYALGAYGWLLQIGAIALARSAGRFTTWPGSSRS